MDTFYPSAYSLTEDMDKKYPLYGVTSRRGGRASGLLELNICEFNRLILSKFSGTHLAIRINQVQKILIKQWREK